MVAKALVLALALAAPLAVSAIYLRPVDVPTAPAVETSVIYFADGEFPGATSIINPFLAPNDLSNTPSGVACATRYPWQTCDQYLSMFSGLAVAGVSRRSGYRFLGMTDRGPNVDCGDLEDFPTELATAGITPDPGSFDFGQGFPIGRFAPSFFELSMDKDSGKMALGRSCYLKDSRGNPVNGLSNLAGVDPVNYGYACVAGTEIPYSQAGIDPEDIQLIGDTGLVAMVDEYTPSIIIAKGLSDDDGEDDDSCGRIVARYVPKDSALTSAGAGYPIIKVLPELFTFRRRNRGMENLAVSADGKTLIAMLQSPLKDSDPATALSPVTTAVHVGISEVRSPRVLGVYLYIEESAMFDATRQWVDAKEKQSAVKLSGFADAGPVLGLPSSESRVVVAIERAKNQVKVFMVDFSCATDVSGLYGGNPLKFDSLGDHTATLAALASMGISPARKALVFDTQGIKAGASGVAGWASNDKLEGVGILNKCVLAVGNDNDFGFGAETSNLSIVQLEKCLDALYAEIRCDAKKGDDDRKKGDDRRRGRRDI